MSIANLKMPKEVYCGNGALGKIPDILRSNNVKKLAVFTSANIEDTGILDPIYKSLDESGIEKVVFNDLPAEPTYSQAQTQVDACNRIEADFILAVGGGSVMDAAKIASILVGGNVKVADLLDDPLLANKKIRSLMVPTTAGTGAEATPNAIVAVPEKSLKVGIVNADMIPDYVVLDPAMIKALPKKLAAATGVDALCHAIECFTGNKANCISDTYALEALDLILNNIVPACTDCNAITEKERMQLAAFYAGVAITASGTTAVHALSYPLGGKYHIAHGVSNAILLVPVMKFNKPACTDTLAKAFDRCCHNGTVLESEEAKADYMIAWMERIVKTLEIPTNLSEFGVPSEDLDALADAGMEVTRLLNNNMRKVTREDAIAIYSQVM